MRRLSLTLVALLGAATAAAQPVRLARYSHCHRRAIAGLSYALPSGACAGGRG